MKRLSTTPVRIALAAIIVVVVGVAFWMTHSSTSTSPNKDQHQAQGLGDFAAPSGVAAQPLGEIGPGACWPATSFANAHGGTQASGWYRTVNPKVAAAAKRDAAYLLAHADYYLPREVVPNWDQLQSDQERMVAYTAKLSVQQLTSPMRVQNTYCDKATGQVANWKTQVFPVGEWIGFVPGHEPGTTDPRPARKMACGNWLTRPPVTSEVPPLTTTPATTTSKIPPPPTTTPNAPKIPGEAPSGGTGSDRQTAGPVAPPAVPKPVQPGPAPAPAPPPANPVPGGSSAPPPSSPLPVESGGGGPTGPSNGCVPSPTDPC